MPKPRFPAQQQTIQCRDSNGACQHNQTTVIEIDASLPAKGIQRPIKEPFNPGNHSFTMLHHASPICLSFIEAFCSELLLMFSMVKAVLAIAGSHQTVCSTNH